MLREPSSSFRVALRQLLFAVATSSECRSVISPRSSAGACTDWFAGLHRRFCETHPLKLVRGEPTAVGVHGNRANRANRGFDLPGRQVLQGSEVPPDAWSVQLFDFGEVFLREFQNVANIGSPEGIECLVVVAHHAFGGLSPAVNAGPPYLPPRQPRTQQARVLVQTARRVVPRCHVAISEANFRTKCPERVSDVWVKETAVCNSVRHTCL
jgi:hypothetical protein